jgi:hypothetical protein
MSFLQISGERGSAPNTDKVAKKMEKLKEIIEALVLGAVKGIQLG